MKPDDAKVTSTNDENSRRERLKFRVEVVGAVILVFTLVATTWQAVESNRANAINWQSLKTVQRAFVAQKALKAQPVGIAEKRQWRIGATWENTGSTAAVDLFQFHDAAIMESPPDGKRFIGDGFFNPNFLGPHAERDTVAVIKDSSFVPQIDPRTVTTLSPPRYTWGWMYYADAFGDPHVSEFCVRMDSIQYASATDANPVIIWVQCPIHNCVDRSCPDFDEITMRAQDALREEEAKNKRHR